MENQELPEPETPGVATFLGVLIILGIIAVPFSLAGGPAAFFGTVCGVISLFVWRLLIVYIYEASYWARQSALIAQKQYLLARGPLTPAAATTVVAAQTGLQPVKVERLITPGGIVMIVSLVGAILMVFYFMNDVLKK